MFVPQNKFIIVDDISDHLNLLSKQFFDNGIGCKAFLYDAFYDTPLKGIKVAFFDVAINPSGGSSEHQIFNNLASGIKQYIHIDNGPFALVFWTSNILLIDRFKKFVESRISNMPKPFMIGCIDKVPFLNTVDQSLKEKLIEVLDDQIIQILFDFESNLEVAATTTIKRIYDIIPKNDKWGCNENFSKAFEVIFSKIAISTLGFQHAKENPDKAVNEALSQILLHQVLKSPTADTWAPFLTSLKSIEREKDLQCPVDFKESELNSIFHIELNNLKKDSRGIVLNIVKNNKRIRNLFNKSYQEWVHSFIPFKCNFKEADKNASLLRIEKLIGSSKLIAIEISSACDYSQNKNRLNKYLYGVIINKDETCFVKNSSDSTLEVGQFFLNKIEFSVWVNLNYVFSALPSDKFLGKPLFLLKKEITDLIGNRYANHVSRIGITSFRS